MKDFQQLSLIKMHIVKKKIKTNIVECPTIRANNGLALSSRNTKLKKHQITKAGKIYSYLKKNKKMILKSFLTKKN